MPTRTPRRQGHAGVHSIDHVAFSVPDIGEAERFYRAFGLDVRLEDGSLGLYIVGHDHRWVSIHQSGQAKKLEYVCYGIYEIDLEALRQRVQARGLAADPHPLGNGEGLWLRDPDGILVQLVVAPKVSPSHKCRPVHPGPGLAGQGAAPARSNVSRVEPRWLSHVLFFTPDVERMLRFSEEVLGLRLSDRSGDIIAFLHGPHGSDHHLVAYAKSGNPGLHHTSWDVGNIDAVGCGAEQMRIAGYKQGWGVGRHVLGSNYFHYVRDPWGSYAEYSFDIDFIPHDLEWPAADHPPEDSLYVWGPSLPEDFIVNHEHHENRYTS